MIIACPACMTRYVVPDTSIGPEGRTVRCAKCRHSWFQDGPDLAGAEQPRAALQDNEAGVPDPTPADAPQGDEVGAVDQSTQDQGLSSSDDASDVAEPSGDWPRSAPLGAGRVAPPFAHASGPSRFEAGSSFSGRRNILRLWTWVAAIFAALALGAIVAIYAWGLPNWVPVNRPTFAAAQPELQLDFPLEQQERRQLPNGTEYFGASGTVTNTGSVSRTVPPILIVLRDEQERIVYSWEVVPPQRTLGPGETMAINEAVTDVPRSARVAEIGWKPD